MLEVAPMSRVAHWGLPNNKCLISPAQQLCNRSIPVVRSHGQHHLSAKGLAPESPSQGKVVVQCTEGTVAELGCRVRTSKPSSGEHETTVGCWTRLPDKIASAAQCHVQEEAGGILQHTSNFLASTVHPPPGYDASQLISSTTSLAASILRLHQQHSLIDNTALAVSLIAPSLILSWLDVGSVHQAFGSHVASAANDVLLLLKAAKHPDLDSRALSDWYLQAGSPQAALLAAAYCHQKQQSSASGTGSSLDLGPILPSLQHLINKLGLTDLLVQLTSPTSSHSSSAWFTSAHGVGSGRLSPRIMCSSVDVDTSTCELEPAQFPAVHADVSSQAELGRQLEQQTEVRIASNRSASTSNGIGSYGRQSNGHANGHGPKGTRPGSLNGGVTPTNGSTFANGWSNSEAMESQGSGVAQGGQQQLFQGATEHSSTATSNSQSAAGRQPSSQALLFPTNSMSLPNDLLGRPQRSGQQQETTAEPSAPTKSTSPASAATTLGMRSMSTFTWSSDEDLDDEDFEELEPQRPPTLRERRQQEARAALAQKLNQVKAQPMRLVPLGSTNGTYQLLDPETGAPLAPGSSITSNDGGVALPLVGPWVLSNSSQTFRTSDAVVHFETPRSERLAVRLEFIQEHYDMEKFGVATLHVFNISRVVRGRQHQAAVMVNGKPLGKEGSQALAPGDVIELGQARGAPKFRVEAVPDQAPGEAVQAAVQRYCRGLPRNGKGQAMASGQPAVFGRKRGSKQAADSEATYQELEASYQEHASEQPLSPKLWLSWAQFAARNGRLHRARDLFRTAAAAASAIRAANPPPPPPVSPVYSPSTAAAPGPSAAAPGPAAAALGPASDPLDPHIQASKVLSQVMYHWARFEWGQRMYGSARHLWRAAADLSLSTSDGGPTMGGAGIILFTWASAEHEQHNVSNARVVVAEALRKCSEDQPLYVLAAGIELAAGNYELAKAFCLKAYEMDRKDKHLYYVWPRVMAALGEHDRARVLYERGLEYHPMNTKLMNLYAAFEYEQGDYPEARELHKRALALDPTSLTTMHNRVSYASMECDLDNMRRARKLLEVGLQHHPNHAPALITLARVYRLIGLLDRAQELLWKASKLTHQFDEYLLRERALVYRALGEMEMYRSLSQHLASVKRLSLAKQTGTWSREAWVAYVEETKTPQRQALVKAAMQRKVELGWLSRPGVPGPKAARNDGTGWQALQPRSEEAREQAAKAARASERIEMRKKQRRAQLAQAREAERAAAGVDAAGAAAVVSGEFSDSDDEDDDEEEDLGEDEIFHEDLLDGEEAPGQAVDQNGMSYGSESEEEGDLAANNPAAALLRRQQQQHSEEDDVEEDTPAVRIGARDPAEQQQQQAVQSWRSS